MLVMMTERAVVRRDLNRKGTHKVIRDDEMVPRLLFNRDRVIAGICVLVHGYSFEGLNSTTTRRTSWSPTLVSPLSG